MGALCLQNICLVNTHNGESVGFVSTTGKKSPRRKAGRRSKEPPRFDMDFYFEAGYKVKVAESLQSKIPTRRVLALFRSERDRQTLTLLLCHVVFCREHQLKTDHVIEWMSGTTADNVENAQERIENFCQWLWLHLHHNYDLHAFDEARTVIPTLLNIADVIAQVAPAGRQFAKDWKLAYEEALDSLARFIEDKTGKPRHTAMVTLLKESAHALGKNQTYDAHAILVRLKNRCSK
jgi:hypothetical protein